MPTRLAVDSSILRATASRLATLAGQTQTNIEQVNALASSLHGALRGATIGAEDQFHQVINLLSSVKATLQEAQTGLVLVADDTDKTETDAERGGGANSMFALTDQTAPGAFTPPNERQFLLAMSSGGGKPGDLWQRIVIAIAMALSLQKNINEGYIQHHPSNTARPATGVPKVQGRKKSGEPIGGDGGDDGSWKEIGRKTNPDGSVDVTYLDEQKGQVLIHNYPPGEAPQPGSQPPEKVTEPSPEGDNSPPDQGADDPPTDPNNPPTDPNNPPTDPNNPPNNPFSIPGSGEWKPGNIGGGFPKAPPDPQFPGGYPQEPLTPPIIGGGYPGIPIDPGIIGGGYPQPTPGSGIIGGGSPRTSPDPLGPESGGIVVEP